MSHLPEPCLCGALDCPRCYGSDAGRFRHQQRVEDAYDEIVADAQRWRDVCVDFLEGDQWDALTEILRIVAHESYNPDELRRRVRAITDPLIKSFAESQVEESYE